VNTAPAPSRVVTRPAVTARAPSSTEPTLSCTLWEDERCIVVQVVVGGHVVARRTDNDWVNSTKLLNVGAFLLKRVAVVCGSRKAQC
jgi:hypothetical protein